MLLWRKGCVDCRKVEKVEVARAWGEVVKKIPLCIGE